ncbi:MAG: metal-dependent hydrolase [Bacteroidia bacterium]|nr:metal-dependent hydrolase [Bacteroidia bacterium]
MDSLTQIVLGAATGEVVLGRKIGNKAMLWGAIAGTIPDLDVIPSMFLDTVSGLEIHRGFSHSILFDVLFAPVFGWLVWKLYKGKGATWRDWSLLFFWGLFTHPLLDCFTTWGTQLFWPLAYRVAFHNIFVVDPGYTLPFLICCIIVLFLKRESPRRRLVNWIGIGLSSAYMIFTLGVKFHMNQVFTQSMEKQGIVWERYSTRPAPLTTILWTVNAETRDGFQIGYHSLLDHSSDVQFAYVAKNHELLDPIRDEDQVQRLIALTTGFFTVEHPEPNHWVINDLRFGQAVDWETGTGDFVFAYHIFQEADGLRVEQSRNNPKDAPKIMNAFFKRLKGV